MLIRFLLQLNKEGAFFCLERDFEESLSSSGQIALANYARRDDSKAIQMLDVVQVVRAADLHSVQDIVEINPQLRPDSFAEEEPLGKSQCLVTIERSPQARIVWSGSPDGLTTTERFIL